MAGEGERGRGCEVTRRPLLPHRRPSPFEVLPCGSCGRGGVGGRVCGGSVE